MGAYKFVTNHFYLTYLITSYFFSHWVVLIALAFFSFLPAFNFISWILIMALLFNLLIKQCLGDIGAILLSSVVIGILIILSPIMPIIIYFIYYIIGPKMDWLPRVRVKNKWAYHRIIVLLAIMTQLFAFTEVIILPAVIQFAFVLIPLDIVFQITDWVFIRV